MKCYIICHKPTGNIFPQQVNKAGQTWIDFASPDKVLPRLWRTESLAHAWLTRYCKGRWTKAYKEALDDFGHPYTYFAGLQPEPGTERDIAEYVIIPVTITNT